MSRPVVIAALGALWSLPALAWSESLPDIGTPIGTVSSYFSELHQRLEPVPVQGGDRSTYYTVMPNGSPVLTFCQGTLSGYAETITTDIRTFLQRAEEQSLRISPWMPEYIVEEVGGRWREETRVAWQMPNGALRTLSWSAPARSDGGGMVVETVTSTCPPTPASGENRVASAAPVPGPDEPATTGAAPAQGSAAPQGAAEPQAAAPVQTAEAEAPVVPAAPPEAAAPPPPPAAPRAAEALAAGPAAPDGGRSLPAEAPPQAPEAPPAVAAAAPQAAPAEPAPESPPAEAAAASTPQPEPAPAEVAAAAPPAEAVAPPAVAEPKTEAALPPSEPAQIALAEPPPAPPPVIVPPEPPATVHAEASRPLDTSAPEVIVQLPPEAPVSVADAAPAAATPQHSPAPARGDALAALEPADTSTQAGFPKLVDMPLPPPRPPETAFSRGRADRRQPEKPPLRQVPAPADSVQVNPLPGAAPAAPAQQAADPAADSLSDEAARAAGDTLPLEGADSHAGGPAETGSLPSRPALVQDSRGGSRGALTQDQCAAKFASYNRATATYRTLSGAVRACP